MTPTQAGALRIIVPFINIPGLLQLGTHSSALVYTRVNQYQAADSISWTHEKHSIRAGFEFDHEFYYYNLQGFPIGQDYGEFLRGPPSRSARWSPGPARLDRR